MSIDGVPDGIRETAHRLADAASVVTLRHFRSAGLAAANKASLGFDPVTIADRESESAMRDILAEARPDDAVLGEEQAFRPGTSGLTWVLDPIDGTRAFLAGAPTWGVLIGVRDETRALYGMVCQPFTGERFEGGGAAAHWSRDGGAPRRLATRATGRLSEAILMSTFPEIGSAAEHAAFARVAGRARLTRYGLDCYAYALLAHGAVDVVIEAGLQSYDIVAPAALIEAAGGVVTTWQGGSPLEGGCILATANPALHEAALDLLAAR